MTARTVTFSIEVGSGGFEIARGVAEKLTYRYYDWEIVNEIASKVGASPDQVAAAAERLPSLAERIMQQLAFVSYASPESSLGDPSPETLRSALQTQSDEQYRRLIEVLVKDLGSRGEAVIVGHASQLTLQDTPGVLKVLIHGSLKQRQERLAAERGISLAEAESVIKQLDKQRATFFRKVHGVDWLQANLYDLSFSTDQLSVADVESWIITAADSLDSIPAEPVST
jgi:cytidylate kinase